MPEQTKALAPSAPKKISRDTLSQVHDYYLPLIREQFSQHGLEMKLIDVEYTFDNNKIYYIVEIE